MIARVDSKPLRNQGGARNKFAAASLLSIVSALALLPAALFAAPPQNKSDAPDPLRTQGAAYYEIVYADANIGASSGGHSALKFGRTVYHYQMYRDGVFRLVRDDWSSFRRLYNDRENRSLGLRTVRIPHGKLRRLKDFFALRYLVQQAHLRYFTDLQHEREFWQALAAAPVAPRVPVPGYGLFEKPGIKQQGRRGEDSDERRQNEASGALREAIVKATGIEFSQLLTKRRAAIHARIRATLGLNIDAGIDAKIDAKIKFMEPGASGDAAAELAREFDPDRLPQRAELFSGGVREDLNELAALAVLAEQRPLKRKVLFDSGAGQAPAHAKLRDTERDALRKYRAVLEGEIISLLQTPAAIPGADRGATLLLNLARHRAISLSLAENRLLTLDPFPARRVSVSAAAIQRDRALVHQMAAVAQQALQRTRRYVFAAGGGLSEVRYNRLEAAAARYFEIRRGAEEPGYSIRTVDAATPMIPGTAHPALLHFPREMLPTQWSAFVEAGGPALRWRLAQDREARYLERLRQGYDYHLIRKNCVTELLLSIEAGGGVPEGLKLDHRFRFIPFVAFDLFAAPESRQTTDSHSEAISSPSISTTAPAPVSGPPLEAFAIADANDPDVRWLPSYRKRRLARILEREGRMIAAPRESFADLSTIYTPRPQDTAFLLFTDDIFWARPLYGAANLAYGLATSGAGVFSAPFDRGERLQSGLRGALFSFPELVWFNIRKGSFDLPPDETLAPPRRASP
ncbi:MAG: hypothetical protein NXI24_06625 [bacterium]|nr:hypothetical protein [bacterium]